MNINISLQNEDTPSIAPRMFTHEKFEDLDVNEAQIVHFSVYFAYIYSKNSYFVSVNTVQHKPNINLDFEFGL